MEDGKIASLIRPVVEILVNNGDSQDRKNRYRIDVDDNGVLASSDEDPFDDAEDDIDTFANDDLIPVPSKVAVEDIAFPDS